MESNNRTICPTCGQLANIYQKSEECPVQYRPLPQSDLIKLRMKFDNIQSFEHFESLMEESIYRWFLYYIIKEVLKDD